MKWLTGFWRATSRVLPTPIGPDVVARLSELDPEHIYLENVRSIMNVSATQARLICDTAVRRGFFRRKLLVLCPDGTVAASAATHEELPSTVRCWTEIDGDIEPSDVQTSMLRTLEVFSLNG
jgi:hypothetical protein